jgi:glycosyltransferase involved in cell wall biosynthesis
MFMPPRIALVTNVLSHYRVPCFQALAARMPGRIDFFLLSATMPHRAYVMAAEAPSVSVRILPGWSFHRPPYDDLHLNDPRPALRGYTLLILGGWAEPTFLLLWTLAQLKRMRVAFWVESTLNDLARTTWRESLKRLMLRRAAGVIVPGQNAAAYCEWLGVPRTRIFTAPNAVNTTYFKQQAKTLLPQRDELRRELGLDGVVIVFIGRMVEAYKNVSVLIRAQQQLEACGQNANLVLIGEGEDRAEYERLAHVLKVHSIRFIDFLNHDALCRYYAAADIFVLPSRSETWGFVLNEAMEFGLPLVVTPAVGAAPDLVKDGENGLIVPTGDVDALANALARLVTDSDLRRKMGAASQQRIAAFTPEIWADGLVRAIEAMTNER